VRACRAATAALPCSCPLCRRCAIAAVHCCSLCRRCGVACRATGRCCPAASPSQLCVMPGVLLPIASPSQGCVSCCWALLPITSPLRSCVLCCGRAATCRAACHAMACSTRRVDARCCMSYRGTLLSVIPPLSCCWCRCHYHVAAVPAGVTVALPLVPACHCGMEGVVTRLSGTSE
jgi:hypothetical protein